MTQSASLDPKQFTLAFAQQLNARGLAYCHWKSNEHLDAGLRGKTDLDILVAQEDAQAFRDSAHGMGFKPVVAAPHAAYPGIEDLLGFDPESGKLIHLHLHTQLLLGTSNLKEYRLPWEAELLQSAIQDKESGLRIADPSMEFVLLNLRHAIKLSGWTRLYLALGLTRFEEDYAREYAWLQQRLDAGRVQELAQRLLGSQCAAHYAAMLQSPPAIGNLRALRRPLLAELRQYQRFSSGRLFWLRTGQQLRYIGSKAARRFFGLKSRSSKRSPQTGGQLIAILGSDGAGKSTVVGETYTWIAWKVKAEKIYFGSGSGPKSIARRAMSALARGILALTGRKRSPTATPKPGSRASSSSWYARLYRILHAALLTREKARHIQQANRLRQAGCVVICDRFPQTQVAGYMDGPLLADYRQSPYPWLRWLSRREQAVYRSAMDNPPDLVLKLDIDAQTALDRKQERSLEETKQRIEAIRSLDFPPSTRVVEIDARQSRDAVVRTAKAAIWETL